MGKVDGLTQDIESLRGYLNELIENDENQAELLLVSQQLDELLVEYYTKIYKPVKAKN